MWGSLDSLAEITSTSAVGFHGRKKSRLSPGSIAQQPYPESIPAVSAGCSSRNCSADIAGLNRGNRAHKPR